MLSKEAISKCYEDSDLNEVLDRAEKLMEKIKIQTSQVDWTSMIYDFHLEKSFYEDCIDFKKYINDILNNCLKDLTKYVDIFGTCSFL